MNVRSKTALAVFVAGALAAGSTESATATEFKTLHDFCVQDGCVDGQFSDAPLAMDAAGNLYGTTNTGGVHDEGTVYALFWRPDWQSWKFKVLYNFCTLNNCADGAVPSSVALVVDTAGNLYGTTAGGGAGNDTGTVFRLAPNKHRTKWTLDTLYSFCTRHSDCSDGANPESGLTYQGAPSGALYDGVSPLYGTTIVGGQHLRGVVYQLSPRTRASWSEKVLYGFCARGGSGCTDGAAPEFPPLLDPAGNVYGTTLLGGAQGKGVVYQLSPQLDKQKWAETSLHDFCSAANCADGWIASGTLVMDSSGNLFGTTEQGGSTACSGGCGVVYEIPAGGSESVIHDFCPECADGFLPFSGLVSDGAGNFLGTANAGGANGAGTLYRLSGSTFTVLYAFCAETNCADGGVPGASAIPDGAGNLFGTTERGGADQGGTVYELTP